jgi:hypothetical protein
VIQRWANMDIRFLFAIIVVLRAKVVKYIKINCHAEFRRAIPALQCAPCFENSVAFARKSKEKRARLMTNLATDANLRRNGATSDLTSYRDRPAFIDSFACECVSLKVVSLRDFQSSVIHTASAALHHSVGLFAR